MLLTPLVFAASAAASLVVPEISGADEGVFRALPIETDTFALPAAAFSQSLDVPCHQCHEDKDSLISLDLSIEDSTRLVLNGFELYPNADPWGGDLKAAVVQDGAVVQEEDLGYSLTVKPVAVNEEQHLQLINVELKVLQVGNRFINGVPTIQVQLIQALSQELAIGRVALIETSEEGCSFMMCRAKQLADKLFKALKGCAGRMRKGHNHHHNAAGQKDQGVPSVPGGHADKPTKEHQGKEHQGHRYNWHHLFKNIATHIFLPVLMGVTAGVGVAMCAMVLCTIAVRLTSLVRSKRSQNGRCCRKKQVSREEGADVEKVSLMEAAHEEPPPQYADGESKN